MMEYRIILIALLPHYGSPYLAQANAMSPARTNELEVLWHSALYMATLYNESRTIQMSFTQRASYL